MRFVFILAGVGLLERFHWLIYVFGAFLVLTGIKMALPKKEEFEPERNVAVRLFRRLYPVTSHYDQGRFFTQANGRRAATPLFLVLLIIETTDVAFALDSIPAVLAITSNAFIVFHFEYLSRSLACARCTSRFTASWAFFVTWPSGWPSFSCSSARKCC